MLFGIGRTCNFGDYKWEIKKFPNLESGEFWLHKEQYQFADRWLFDCEDDAKDFLIEYGIEEKVIKKWFSLASIYTLVEGELDEKFSQAYVNKMMGY
ncbi:hypothetical protein MGGS36055_01190 [Streptococcus dysgalactiae subsp. equisimilis]|uniref:hypothetical protein n=1 Tax=Streptococcus TaxID=1301 RepID=UPI000617F8F9|nr:MULTISPECIES: hypothetical protein [Streptococcus]QBX15050.1 hypothetical protein Javan169_0045 [Streptococcus phage Javan169]KKC20707.1 hypothetical protein WH14_00365 [Streptococcus dysgalactiae subsp. equisimilis]WEQ79960.1 hypothetical protein MGGS36055_01190 [Streptococcus dysgalactiae subsp. equisimilis]VTT03003.1 Uncharacterised protein [Streptococcus dysgalactiae subsp. equisimilis]VTT18268.1 Uncharacterised protein [Streptococcus dysgalactiae subsp. equisimilis]